MFTKILKLENIKQWQHKGGADLSFDKLNLIYGRNGSGKSTLGNIFEHINHNDIAGIKSLSSIETEGEPNLSFMIDGNTINLRSLTNAVTFQVFNQSFIDNNLYTSKGTDSSQLVNYYEFSLGMVAVTHQQEIDRIKSNNDILTSNITTHSTIIRAKFNNKKISEIKKIKKIDDVEIQLKHLQVKLQDIRSIEHFKNRGKLSTLNVERPILDKSCFVTTIAKLSKEAQHKVSEHIKVHLTEQDDSWIEDGRNLVTESNNCPFCAQPLSGSPIYHLYQEYMNDVYLTAVNTFELNASLFELDVSSVGVAIEEQEDMIKRNTELIREWSDRIQSIEPKYDFDVYDKLSNDLNYECRKLIIAKEKDFLANSDFSPFDDVLEKIFSTLNFTDYNALIEKFNEDIDIFILGLGTETSSSVQARIDNVDESKVRFSIDVTQNLTELKKLELDKASNTKKITELRTLITTEQYENIGKHENSINELLKNFNSMIRIKKLIKDNRGHRGASRITYAITFIGNELSIINDNERIFEHVLSLGDRSALALAFFLSKFKNENTNNTIITLDDPMSSLDGHRRNATIVEIAKLMDKGYQTFILSHDPFFLSEVMKHSILSKDTKCFEIEVEYTDLDPLNPESSQYTSSKLLSRKNYESYVIHSYHKEYNKLHDFVKSGSEEGKTEIARSIRPVLEAYLRFLFPKQFTEGLWLGDMIKLIRNEKEESSPLYDKNNKFDSIEKINEFSKSYHHAEGFDTRIQGLDIQTVKSYAKETLLFITGF